MYCKQDFFGNKDLTPIDYSKNIVGVSFFCGTKRLKSFVFTIINWCQVLNPIKNVRRTFQKKYFLEAED